MPIVDEISPDFIGEDRIKLSLSELTPAPRAFSPVQIDVDYSDADDIGGIVRPLELTVTAPTPANFRRRIIRKSLPSSIIIKPQEGGEHLVVLKECGHNKAVGIFVLDVAGEPTEEQF